MNWPCTREEDGRAVLGHSNSCNWDDEDFVDGYPLFKGSLLASTIPLSASALESLLQCTNLGSQTKEIVFPLRLLLIGWPDEKAPIQVLHQSFRDFLTGAQSSFLSTRGSTADVCCCAVSLTLTILVGILRPSIPCAGFIDSDKEGVPKMTGRVVSGTLVCV